MTVEVERAAGTKTIANLWRRAEGRSGTAYMVETADGWRDVSWDEARTAVDELANGLLASGVGKGDALGILGRTTLEWVLFDFALGSIGAIGAGIYPSLPAKDVAYILDHADAVGVLAENEEQLAKVEAERANLPKLRHVLAFGDLDELRARDLFTYIDTSGTTGPPKACMITHRNY